jgi:DNA-binding LytR/AlgR family response regulator
METGRYRCLVADDEPIARKIIISYIEQMPLLALEWECINALDTIDYLRAHRSVDIIFLDINMPNLTGLQLVKILLPAQPVIFTTAYSEHAVESYELNAIDYLLKPFSFERFTKAVYKAIDQIARPYQGRVETSDEGKAVLFLKSDGKNYPVSLDDIVYCEAMKNYTRVLLKNGQELIPLLPLSKMDIQLAAAGGGFIQIHRSFLIARKHITAITANSVILNKFEIPIGIQFKEGFFKAIGMKDN